jgi:hypothetical protein
MESLGEPPVEDDLRPESDLTKPVRLPAEKVDFSRRPKPEPLELTSGFPAFEEGPPLCSECDPYKAATSLRNHDVTLDEASTLFDNPLARESDIKVCVICCSTSSMPIDAARDVASSMSRIAKVEVLLLSDCNGTLEGGGVVKVPIGTKLSKIRRLAALAGADLICICDPDMRFDAEACVQVLERAVTWSRQRAEVVAFGIIEGSDNGSLLSRVVALDKWVSHRVLRRWLWECGIGITLPGQFLIASAGLLRVLDPGVDTYLDDLYLGWIARTRGVKVLRVPVVVGEEQTRATWGSLMSQRVRWMKGLARLFVHLLWRPKGALLLTIHFLAYHGLPIVMLLGLVYLSTLSLLAAATTFSALVALMAWCSGRSLATVATFLTAFPLVHFLAVTLCWIPLSSSYLARR